MRSLLLALVLAGCTTTILETTPPEVLSPSTSEFTTRPSRGQITVAVYTFNDMTGQRNGSTLSTAVTQGAENYLIDSLKEFAGGSWFRVVERTNVEHLVRERQIVNTARQSADDETTLPPLLFAGVILSGGIIGYDANVESGGDGARIFGIGATNTYTTHTITVALRAVSVATGEVLCSVVVEKQILSYTENFTTMKFFDLDTQTIEIESGTNTNEAPSHAVHSAVDSAILALVLEGIDLNLW